MATDNVPFTMEYIKPFGTIFLNLLKFIVVPIVLSTIIVGIISLKDIKTVGVIGIKTICFYIGTTAFAVTVGLIISNLFKGTYGVLQTSGLEYQATQLQASWTPLLLSSHQMPLHHYNLQPCCKLL